VAGLPRLIVWSGSSAGQLIVPEGERSLVEDAAPSPQPEAVASVPNPDCASGTLPFQGISKRFGALPAIAVRNRRDPSARASRPLGTTVNSTAPSLS